MANVRISAIAAITDERGLGKDNHLLVHIPGELPRFKQITMGHPIIMGRKTFESIGRVLPNRANIIISRKNIYNSLKADESNSVIVCQNLEQAIGEAIQAAKQTEVNEIFIIGGGQIFAEALPQIDRLYLTVIHKNFPADVFFPDYSDFTKVIEKEENTSEGFSYTFLTLER